MADISPTGDAGGSEFNAHRRSLYIGPIWTGALTAYLFYCGSNHLEWIKTTDGGDTWSAPGTIFIGGIEPSMNTVWFDRWTPGDSGNIIHIALFDWSSDDVQYYAFNTVTDTFLPASTASGTIVYAGVSAGSFGTGGRHTHEGLCISKSRGGVLYIGFDIDNGTETGFYYSTDNGATWNSRADFHEGTGFDTEILLPGSSGNNMFLVYWDENAQEISLKTFDSAANSWSEQSIATSMTYGAIAGGQSSSGSSVEQQMQMAASVRHTDGHVLLAAWSNYNNADNDLRFWDITDATTITEKTQIATNQQFGLAVDVFIDQNTNNIFVSYLRGASLILTEPFYRKSTDGGLTWGAETLLAQDGQDCIKGIWAGQSVTGEGRFRPVWFISTGVDGLDFWMWGYEPIVAAPPASCSVNITSPGSTVARDDPTVEWAISQSVQVSYIVRIYRDAGQTNLVYSSGITTTAVQNHHVDSDVLLDGNTYYIRVDVILADSTTCSDTQTTTIGLPTPEPPPQPEPPEEEDPCWAEVLSGMHGPVAIAYRYYLRNRNNGTLSEITDAIVNASIDFDAQRDITRSAYFEFNPMCLPEDFQGIKAMTNLPSQYVGVDADLVVLGETVTFPLGLFRLSSNVRPELGENQQQRITADGLDLAVLLTAAPGVPFTLPARTNYVSAVIRILSLVGLTRHGIVSSTKVTPVDFTWAPGTSYLTIVNDLLEGVNFWPLWFDGSGIARTRFRGDPENAEFFEDVRYTTVEPVLVMPPLLPEQDWERAANQVIATINDPARAVAGVVAVNKNVAPNGTNILGKVITTTIDGDRTPDLDTLRGLAKYHVVEQRSRTMTAELTTLPDIRRNPRRRLQEIYRVELDSWMAGREHWMSVGWTLDMSGPGIPMIHRLQAITPGAITDVADIPVEEIDPPIEEEEPPPDEPTPEPSDNVLIDSTYFHEGIMKQGTRLGPIWTNQNTAYMFYSDQVSSDVFGVDLTYRKTTNGGQTWGTPVTIFTEVNLYFSVWYDRDTPGDVGTRIHLVYSHPGGGKITYSYLDISNDGLGPEITVFSTVSSTALSYDTFHGADICKSRGGRLFITFQWANGVSGFYESTDNGVTWTAKLNPQEVLVGASDIMLLMPGNEVDSNDMWLIYFDHSTQRLYLKTFDESANTWSSQLITALSNTDGSGTSTSQRFEFHACQRSSDNHVLVAIWDSRVYSTTGEIEIYDINGAASITQMTSAASLANLSPDETYFGVYINIFVNRNNNHLYVAYMRGSNGSDTEPYYRKSTDGGASWGTETPAAAASDFSRADGQFIRVGEGTASGRFMPIFAYSEPNRLLCSPDNSVVI